MTFNEIKEALKDKDLSFEQRQWIAYIEGILNKGLKPNEHCKYCKEKLIESINEQEEV
jgi:hypothetical protein